MNKIFPSPQSKKKMKYENLVPKVEEKKVEMREQVSEEEDEIEEERISRVFPEFRSFMPGITEERFIPQPPGPKEGTQLCKLKNRSRDQFKRTKHNPLTISTHTYQ
jgi:hypothetical protein